MIATLRPKPRILTHHGWRVGGTGSNILSKQVNPPCECPSIPLPRDDSFMASFVGTSHGAVSMIRPHVSTIFCHARGMLRTCFSDEETASVVLQCMMKGSYRQ